MNSTLHSPAGTGDSNSVRYLTQIPEVIACHSHVGPVPTILKMHRDMAGTLPPERIFP